MPSSTRLKIDEDLSDDVASLLRSNGFDARSVREQGLVGKPDLQLWRLVQREGRVFVTADKGFGLLAQRTVVHHGLVLLRAKQESRREVLRLIRKLIDAKLLDSVRNTVISVMPDRIRIRAKR